jgi:hypothetical protein
MHFFAERVPLFRERSHLIGRDRTESQTNRVELLGDTPKALAQLVALSLHAFVIGSQQVVLDVKALVLGLKRFAMNRVLGVLGLTRLPARCLHCEDGFAMLAADLIANVSTTDVQRRVAAWTYCVDAFNGLIRSIRQRGRVRRRL